MSTDDQTFLFADLSGFTALTEVHGDEQAVDLVEDFFDSVRALLPEHAAKEIKTIGDAVMLSCRSPAQAIELGVQIVEDIGRRHGFPVVRVGMHTGPATERDEDWFGASVNLAARIAAAASDGQTLLSGSTADAAGEPDDLVLLERGRTTFRNISQPVRLLQATRKAPADERDLPIDPVCRMAVDPARASGCLKHQGVEYFFCSLQCAQTFAGDPHSYAASRIASGD